MAHTGGGGVGDSKDTLIYSEKPFLPKAKPSKIKALDSRLRGNDDFFSVSLTCLQLGKLCVIPKDGGLQCQNLVEYPCGPVQRLQDIPRREGRVFVVFGRG